MIDPYAREERIEIRMDSGMTEREAIKLTDKELSQAGGREYAKAQIAEAFRVLGREIAEKE